MKRVRDVKKVHGVYLVVRVVLHLYLQVFGKLEGGVISPPVCIYANQH
jgi:hypothetical protein